MYDIAANLQTPNFLASFVQGNEAAQTAKLNKLKVGEAERSAALADKRGKYGNLYFAGVTPEKPFSARGFYDAALQDSAAAGDGEQAMQYTKAITDHDAALAKLSHEQMAAAKSGLEFQGQLLGGVKDQATWDAALGQAKQAGMDVSRFPTQYDPNVVSTLTSQALGAKDRLDQVWKQRQYDFDQQKFGYQQGNDAANRGVTLRGQGITLRGQNMVDARAQATAGASGGAAKATEDERKAAGWLSQARKASDDMSAAMKADPKAAMPGMVEAYSPSDEIGNRSMSPARQAYVQASSAFAEAALRAATGAGVTAEEARQKLRELTPQRGDSPQVISQKIASQGVYLQSLEARAGRAEGSAYKGPTAANSPKPGTVQSGYLFRGGDPADPKSWSKTR